MTKTLLPGGPEGPDDSPGRGADAEERTGDAVRRRIETWWPKGVPRTSPEPEAIAFTRRVVARAAPASERRAVQMLSFCFSYCRWLLEQGTDLDETAIFAPAAVEQYLAGPLSDAPKGTRKPARSLLGALHPGQEGYPPATSTGEAVPVGCAVTEEVEVGEVVDPVQHKIDTYVPKALDPERFARVEHLVRSAVRAIEPANAKRAERALCQASYQAAWVDHSGRPLRADVAFHPDTVEEFLAARLALGANPKSVGTEATELRRIARILFPAIRATVTTQIPGTAGDLDPYSDEEIDEIFASVSRLHTTKQRRQVKAAIVLGLAVGPFRGEYPSVAPESILRLDSELHVTLTGIADGETRTVVALPRFSDLLEEVVEAARGAGDRYLIGGEHPTRNRLANLLQGISGDEWDVPLSIERLRSNFLVALLGQPHSARELLEQAGVTTLGSLDRLMPFVSSAATGGGVDDFKHLDLDHNHDDGHDDDGDHHQADHHQADHHQADHHQAEQHQAEQHDELDDELDAHHELELEDQHEVGDHGHDDGDAQWRVAS